jgi:hypothetical protein
VPSIAGSKARHNDAKLNRQGIQRPANIRRDFLLERRKRLRAMTDKVERTVIEYAWLCIKRAHVQRSLIGMSARSVLLKGGPGVAGRLNARRWRTVA